MGKRYLLITADDLGIGPATTEGILDLAAEGRVHASVLLVNSPYAEDAVARWRSAGQPLALGWHPCLTLDRPVLPPGQVPSLVGPDGRFLWLGGFLRRVLCKGVREGEIEAELRAQLDRFCELVGSPPAVVNSHHHVQVFPPVGKVLARILASLRPLPYVRRIREPWWVLARVPGARFKRGVLSSLGRRDGRRLDRFGFPGNDWLAGVTDPRWVGDPAFFVRWLTCVPGRVVELTCHPGYRDPTLVGRDCTAADGQVERRVSELELLRQPGFAEVCHRAGFCSVINPSARQAYVCVA